LLLNSGTAASDLAHYYLFPRRVVSIEPGMHFSDSDLAMHKGGCIAAYGAQGDARVGQYADQLDTLVCSGEGCLYTIK
jgi:hypothetical protein